MLNFKKGFTLLELLIVIAILAVLATAVILIINPAEYLKQSRDARRLADLDNISKAVNFFDLDNPGIISSTSSSIVYVSVPDTTSTCANLGLPALPTGYSYSCVTSNNLNKIDGTGWIPLNFTKISGGSPISSLPIDPVNSTSSRNYYSYIQGGSFELAASFESASYKMGGDKDKASTDQGSYPDLYEVGSNLTLLPIDYGDPSLMGYWPLDEGSGTIVYDKSGYMNGGISGSATWIQRKTGDNALNFNGASSIRILSPGNRNFSNAHTMTAWINATAISTSTYNILSFYPNAYMALNGNSYFQSDIINGVQQNSYGTTNISANNWYFIAGTFDGNNLKVYLNGNLENSLSSPGAENIVSRFCISGFGSTCSYNYINGSIDDVRLYNRALSAAEISAIYNATK